MRTALNCPQNDAAEAIGTMLECPNRVTPAGDASQHALLFTSASNFLSGRRPQVNSDRPKKGPPAPCHGASYRNMRWISPARCAHARSALVCGRTTGASAHYRARPAGAGPRRGRPGSTRTLEIEVGDRGVANHEFGIVCGVLEPQHERTLKLDRVAQHVPAAA